jgi:hypothetical protein
MAKYQQGDIITIPYPFDDFSTSKVRPAIIVAIVALKLAPILLQKLRLR